jgi:hypothetical protein
MKVCSLGTQQSAVSEYILSKHLLMLDELALHESHIASGLLPATPTSFTVRELPSAALLTTCASKPLGSSNRSFRDFLHRQTVE